MGEFESQTDPFTTVLNHLQEPGRVLARLRTALKPGGWVPAHGERS